MVFIDLELGLDFYQVLQPLLELGREREEGFRDIDELLEGEGLWGEGRHFVDLGLVGRGVP